MTDPYSLPDYQHLLAAVRAAPDDDLPRLVLADWLEENGEGERAEFIRWQCEWAKRRAVDAPLLTLQAARLFVCGKQDADSPIAGRAARLLSEFGTAWCGHLGTTPDVAWQWGWSRGFISRVSGPLVSLIGGACGCPSHDYGEPCDVCNGTGRTTGVLRELVKRETVTTVEVTDKEPWSGNAGELRYWSWVDAMGESANPIHCLPSSLFRHLEWCESNIWRNATVKAYQSPDSARAALSDAILRLVQPVEVPT